MVANAEQADLLALVESLSEIEGAVLHGIQQDRWWPLAACTVSGRLLLDGLEQAGLVWTHWFWGRGEDYAAYLLTPLGNQVVALLGDSEASSAVPVVQVTACVWCGQSLLPLDQVAQVAVCTFCWVANDRKEPVPLGTPLTAAVVEMIKQQKGGRCS